MKFDKYEPIFSDRLAPLPRSTRMRLGAVLADRREVAVTSRAPVYGAHYAKNSVNTLIMRFGGMQAGHPIALISSKGRSVVASWSSYSRQRLLGGELTFVSVRTVHRS